jgi:(p)ppGpp synthase/HD superfamily hydrolase
MDEVLEKVKEFADKAHGEQMRKYTPDRYIIHPIRVMEICREYDSRLPVLSAALLHDVLEDTDVTEQGMSEFLQSIMGYGAAAETLKLVKNLTDVYVKSAYPHLNRDQRKTKERDRIAKTNAASQTIKYADIIDNSNDILANDRQFARKFLKECRDLLQVANKGDQKLYHRAKNTINEGLKQLR